MTVTQSVLLGLYAYVVGWWVVRHGIVTIALRGMDYLTASSPRFAGPHFPSVTAIVPAKDEEAEIAECLTSIQAQSYPNLDILVVDDRSTDRTGAIVRGIAERDDRIQVLTITELPDGWTGKGHALHMAVRHAAGAWLWFLDADTRHAPESLTVVMEYARRQGADLASLLPEMRCETFWERLVQPLMGVVLMRSFPLLFVNNDRSSLAFANGQYILIRREAYDAAGGHEAVRDRFVEDIFLARNVKAAGRPIRVAIGVGISSTRMYSTLSQLVRGWSRILYDAVDRRVGPLLFKIVEPLVFTQTIFLAIAVALFSWLNEGPSRFTRDLLLLIVAHFVLMTTLMWRFYRIQGPRIGRQALWYLPAGFIADWVLAKALAMCWTGRVTWRGTSYGPVRESGEQAATCP